MLDCFLYVVANRVDVAVGCVRFLWCDLCCFCCWFGCGFHCFCCVFLVLCGLCQCAAHVFFLFWLFGCVVRGNGFRCLYIKVVVFLFYFEY